ncbi:MAG: hypothetical protein Q7S35_06120 [Candidatus Limnocylindrales bacterium]|nr:hypothetical protein [Candidatus Limnocylindrales bacterium]
MRGPVRRNPVRCGRAGPAGLVQSPLHAGPLFPHDLLELPPDVSQHVAELVPLQEFLTATLEPLEQVPQADQFAASGVARAPAALHQASERLGQIPLGHHVIGERIENLVRIEIGDPLRAVPA